MYAGDKHSFQLDLPELVVSGRRLSRKPAGVFMVNTSRKGKKGSSNEKFMLEKQCALVTADPWIWKIYNIPTGSQILLYANQIGVVAMGVATGERRMEMLNGEIAHYVRLRNFMQLHTSLTTQEIYRAAEKKYRFQSVMELRGDAGTKVWDAACAKTAASG